MSMLGPKIFNRLRTGISNLKILVTDFPFLDSVSSKKTRMSRIKQTWLFLAELQRAKRASEAPWVRKSGNPLSLENLVVTSAYERPYVVRPYRLGGRGRGVSRYSSRSTIWETEERHLSLAIFCLEKSEKHSFLFATSTNDRRGWSSVSR